LEKEIRVGLIGCGIIGAKQAASFSEIPGVRVVAVADIVEKKSKIVASSVNARSYSKHREMLRDEQLDIVSVATPDHLHREPVLDCVDFGIRNIVCEKPLATNLKDAYEIAEAVKRRRARFCVDFENRWNPTFRSIKLAVSRGVIGIPMNASAMLSNRIDVPYEMWGPPKSSWAKNSTCADFLLSHWTDLVRWIVDREPQTVYAVSQSKKLRFTPDYFQAIMTFEGGFTSYFESSWILSRSQTSIVSSTLDLSGTEGTIYCNHLPKSTFTNLGTEIFSSNHEKLTSINNKLRAEGIATEISVRKEDRNWKGEHIAPSLRSSLRIFKEGHDKRRVNNTFKHMVECVRKSKSPESGIQDGLVQVKMVEAIKHSAEENSPVSIRDL
jgi:predicted dehydrogenase